MKVLGSRNQEIQGENENLVEKEVEEMGGKIRRDAEGNFNQNDFDVYQFLRAMNALDDSGYYDDNQRKQLLDSIIHKLDKNNINWHNQNRRTVLHYAAIYGDVHQMNRLLVINGISICAKDKF